MSLLIGSLLLFILLFFLVVSYHLGVWNSVSDYYSRVWVSSFECGFVSSRLVENTFSYTYFVLLVFFVVFDLEISLLLNMPLQGELYKNFFFYFFFLVILSFGLCAEVYSGYVKWSY